MKKPSLKSLANKAWSLMSKLVRLRAANDNGFVVCVTCEKSFPWKEVHAGHFIHGGHGGKRNRVSYDDRNIHPQCVTCNYYGAKGKACIRYTQFMLKTYGDGIIEDLEIMHRKPCMSREDLEYRIGILKILLRSYEH